MSTTTVLNAYSKGYPSITNRIKASVYTQSNPTAIVASIIDVTAGHPARTWSFPGLPRQNYGFSLDEINAGGFVVNNLALFAVVPGPVDGLLTRNDEQIKCGLTPGFVPGATSFVFDGTEFPAASGFFKPNYIGWEIVPSELTGRGILVRDLLDYTWDKVTGTFQLTQAGDIFPASMFYNIHFNPVQNPIGGSYPTVKDFLINFIDSSTTLDDTYFGSKLICEPATEYIEVTLPDITTIPSGRPMMVEVGGSSLSCVKIIPYGSNTINFLSGNIYALPSESFWIYRYLSSDLTVDEWRISESSGNFRVVGNSLSSDQVQSGIVNAQLLNGLQGDILLHARIYNEFVLNLPVSQVVDYDSWATGTGGINKLFFSLANSANPSFLGKFRFPDRRNFFERNNSSGKAGDYFTDKIKQATYNVLFNTRYNYGSGMPFGLTDGVGGATATIPLIIGDAGALETQPKNYLTNKYILL